MTDKLWCADCGDGTYRNPVLMCDYSDPDVIRVGDTYYLTASTFNYVPGLPILISKDLVNWTLVNYALPNIPDPRYAVPRHAQGVWAPAIRYHDGRFYIYYGMPDEGIFMVSAEDALGQWDPPVCVLPGKGLIDPCPFWDDDGSAWVVHGYAKSRIGFKSILGLFPMSWDGKRAIGDDHLIFDGQRTQPTIEGPKMYKRNGLYYIFAPAGGVATGWQTVLRSNSIHGPYEEKIVLKQGGTVVNGPHQGGWVTAPNGEDWFLHFQSRGLYGRITHLQPMHWEEDGWPSMGVKDEHPVDPATVKAGEDAGEAAIAAASTACGVPVMRHKKPAAPEQPITSEQASDHFTGEKLGLQWQFMGNWRQDFFAVGDGKLKLYARKLPAGGDTLWDAPQVLTQKIACPAFTVDTGVDVAELQPGGQAGIALIGGQYAGMAIRVDENGLRMDYILSGGVNHAETVCESVTTLPKDTHHVALRMTLTPTGYDQAEAVFSFSLDGQSYQVIGKPFSPERGTWVGARPSLFAMPLHGGDDAGSAVFDAFTVTPAASYPFDE